MIPQNNPLANYLSHKKSIDAAMSRVLGSGKYILAGETAAFEKELAKYLGAKYVVCMGSGTDALHLALRATGIGSGDEVITVSHTAVATVAAIEMCSALPALVDIDPNSYTINPKRIESVITGHTKAIVPVHLYGQPANMKTVMRIAKDHQLVVIEDCAQGHGAKIENQRVGTFGDAGAFSFYPTKNLGCLGDGGAVSTNSPEIYEKLVSLRQYGWDQNRVSLTGGFNSRLDELQAAVLLVKLRFLDQNNRRRTQIAQTYNQVLEPSNLVLPHGLPSTTHVYHQYVVRCETKSMRDRLMASLLKKQIQTAIHYSVPVHLQPAYENRVETRSSLHVTEKVSQTVLSLPMFPELTDSQIQEIGASIAEFFEKGG